MCSRSVILNLTDFNIENITNIFEYVNLLRMKYERKCDMKLKCDVNYEMKSDMNKKWDVKKYVQWNMQ